MQVFKLETDADNYQGFVFADEKEAEQAIDWLNGKPLKDVWSVPRIEDAREADEAVLPASDFPMLYSVVPVFSTRAVEALRDLLKPCGELLPLAHDDEQYFAFNVTRIVDVLDEQHSVVRLFANSNRVMMIERYEFIDERVADLTIFKIPQLARSNVYVTNPFIERVEQAHLTGFHFVPVWTSMLVAA